MSRLYRCWSLEEKRAAVLRMSGLTHAVLASELGISRRVLYSWREQLRLLDQKVEFRPKRERALELENQRLKQALGAKALEVDFCKGVLRRIEAQRRPASGSGETVSTRKSE